MWLATYIIFNLNAEKHLSYYNCLDYIVSSIGGCRFQNDALHY